MALIVNTKMKKLNTLISKWTIIKMEIFAEQIKPTKIDKNK